MTGFVASFSIQKVAGKRYYAVNPLFRIRNLKNFDYILVAWSVTLLKQSLTIEVKVARPLVLKPHTSNNL